MSSSAPRTLADQLRGWPAESLGALLAARPDLGVPAPADSAQLAARATTRPSVVRALADLNTFDLACLRRVVDFGPLDLDELQAAFPGADVGSVLERLRSRALVWGDPASLRAVSILAELLDQPVLDDLTVPPLVLVERDPLLVDRTAAGAAFELCRRAEVLLDRWSTTPPGVLRGGGLGIRDLRSVAALLDVDLGYAALLVETSSAAGLLGIGMTPGQDAAWLPTDSFDAWAHEPTTARWVRLARAWLANPRLTALVGRRIGDKPVNALSDGLERGWLVSSRHEVLAVLAAAAPGQALAPTTGGPALVDRLRWLHPRRLTSRADVVEPVLAEAGAVGLTGLGGMSSYARTLLAGGDPEPLLAPLLPRLVDQVLVQADLTAVATGPLEPELARSLGLLADVESSGGATVYRFTGSSLRRAFDAGWSAAEVHAFIGTTSRTPVPQALTYLVDDVARRFGTLRAGAAESFLRSDDEAALTELMHHPKAAGLGLRRIAPTVVVSDVPVTILLPLLRDLGLAPVVETADGTVRVGKPEAFRARNSRQRAPGRTDPSRAAARVSAVVAAIRAGDRVAATRPQQPVATGPLDMVALLREAVESGRQVLLGYVGHDGAVVERIVSPRRVEGGRLTAYDERSDYLREFALHRITGASPL
ncbi:MAG: helicase C-terminal domain-containing protein [Actinomycetota bacterium]|nr:helicase C-terminal domain-containing protein [Actinomycetota bacterium]